MNIISLVKNDPISAFLLSALSVIGWEIIRDRLGSFIYKKQSEKEILNLGYPQIFIDTLRTNEDIEKSQKRLSKCSKLFSADIYSIGDKDKSSIKLRLEDMHLNDVSISSGNITMVHIENTKMCSTSIRTIVNNHNNSISITNSDLSYIEKEESIALILNSLDLFSSITIYYNGQTLKYKITDKSGYIKPIVM